MYHCLSQHRSHGPIFLFQEQLDLISPYLYKLGLLFEVGVDEANLELPPSFIQFNHRILQEFAGAYFVNSRLGTSKDIKVKIW